MTRNILYYVNKYHNQHNYIYKYILCKSIVGYNRYYKNNLGTLFRRPNNYIYFCIILLVLFSKALGEYVAQRFEIFRYVIIVYFFKNLKPFIHVIKFQLTFLKLFKTEPYLEFCSNKKLQCVRNGKLELPIKFIRTSSYHNCCQKKITLNPKMQLILKIFKKYVT